MIPRFLVNDCHYQILVSPHKAGASDEDQFRGLTMKIFNRLGKLVADIPVNETSKVEYDCSGLSNGLYVYYFIGANFKTSSGKLVVIKQ